MGRVPRKAKKAKSLHLVEPESEDVYGKFKDRPIFVVVSQFNAHITDKLRQGAFDAWQQEEKRVAKRGEWAKKQPESIVKDGFCFLTDDKRRVSSLDLNPPYLRMEPYFIEVPGAFEIPLATQWAFDNEALAVVALGAVIRGETDHYQYICQSVTEGLARMQLEWNAPLGFGVLMTDNKKQALARAGGTKGNKGAEAMQAVMTMLDLGFKVNYDSYPES